MKFKVKILLQARINFFKKILKKCLTFREVMDKLNQGLLVERR